MRGLSDTEHELHIFDCERLWRASYQRFQDFGSPHDRDEALLHLHRMNEAILGRSQSIQDRRHAQFEQHITDGVDFFQSPYAMELSRQARRAA